MSARPSLATRLATAAGGPTPSAVATAAPAALQVTRKAATASKAAPEPAAAPAKAREGKTMIAGYFSQDLARAVKMLAVERDVSVQAIIGEGLDAILRQNGKHPFGER